MNSEQSHDATLQRIERDSAIDNAVRMSRAGSAENAAAYYASLTPYEVECRQRCAAQSGQFDTPTDEPDIDDIEFRGEARPHFTQHTNPHEP
jgi:hypothetical protein